MEPNQIVAATLLEASFWLHEDDDERRDLMRHVARRVEQARPDDACCPLCEEVDCDEGCALRTWRSGSHVETRYTRDDMVRAWEEGHEVCDWPRCMVKHVNPYRIPAAPWDRPPANYAEQRALLDDSLRDVPPFPPGGES